MNDFEIWVDGKDESCLTLNFGDETKLRFSGLDRYEDFEATDFITLGELKKLLTDKNSWMDERAAELQSKLDKERKFSEKKESEIKTLKFRICRLQDAIKTIRDVQDGECEEDNG
jgi:hypothetical protein